MNFSALACLLAVSSVMAASMPHQKVTSEALDVLYEAIHNKQPEFVQLLITEGGVDPSTHNSEALRLACAEGNLEVVKALLAHPKVEPNGHLLWVAAVNRHFDVLNYLCESTDVLSTAKHENVVEAFKYAVMFGDMQTFSRLLHHPAISPAMLSSTILNQACAGGHVEMVTALLRDGRVTPTETSLANASFRGQVEVMRVLLADKRIDPAANDNEALRYACLHGQLEAAKLLLACPAVFASADCGKLLGEARANGHQEIVAFLQAIQAQKQVLAEQGERMLAAADRGDFGAVESLLCTPGIMAVLDKTDLERVFMTAVRKGHLEVTKMLVHAVEDVQELNLALYHACEKGFLEIVDILLMQDKVNPAALGNDLLVVATRRGVSMLTRLLVDGRIDVAANGNFALLSAIDNGQLEAVRLLMKVAKVRAALDIEEAIAMADASPAIAEYLRSLRK